MSNIRMLSLEEFNLSLELAPRPVLELALYEEGRGYLLLERREPPYEGTVHFPGGFIARGERTSNTLARLLKKELGVVIPTGIISYIPALTYNNPEMDPRGHLSHFIIEVPHLQSQLEIARNFMCVNVILPDMLPGSYFKECPGNMMLHQRIMFEELLWTAQDRMALLDRKTQWGSPSGCEWVKHLFQP